jgi:hypothetical protein
MSKILQFFFHLSSHQFNMAVKGGCEAMVHGIQSILDVHPNWM